MSATAISARAARDSRHLIAPSAISRELRRNRDPNSGQYRPFTAHKLAPGARRGTQTRDPRTPAKIELVFYKINKRKITRSAKRKSPHFQRIARAPVTGS